MKTVILATLRYIALDKASAITLQCVSSLNMLNFQIIFLQGEALPKQPLVAILHLADEH